MRLKKKVITELLIYRLVIPLLKKLTNILLIYFGKAVDITS